VSETNGVETNPVERIVMWKCVGMHQGEWCKYLMTNTEMQAHKFDLGCPRCKTPFADFIQDDNHKSLGRIANTKVNFGD